MLLAEALIFTGLLTGVACLDTKDFKVDMFEPSKTEKLLLMPDIEYRKIFAPVWAGLLVSYNLLKSLHSTNLDGKQYRWVWLVYRHR